MYYCFICGKDCGGSGKVGERLWSDMRDLLRLLCKLMSVVPRWSSNGDDEGDGLGLNEEEEEKGSSPSSSSCWGSQTCGECYKLLIQMEQLHALLERTRNSLDAHVKQVKSLVVKSGAENVSCQSWTPSFRTFREQVIEASLIRTTRFQPEGGHVPGMSSPSPPPPPHSNVKVEVAGTTTVGQWDEKGGSSNYSPEHEPGNNGGGGDGTWWESSDPLSFPREEETPSLPQPGPSSSSRSAQEEASSDPVDFVKTEPISILELHQSNGPADDDSTRRRSPRNQHHHHKPVITSSCFVRLEKLDPPIMMTSPPRRTPPGPVHKISTSGGGGSNRSCAKKLKLDKKYLKQSAQSSDWDPADDGDGDGTTSDTPPNGSTYAPSEDYENDHDDDDHSGSEEEKPASSKRPKKSKKRSSSATASGESSSASTSKKKKKKKKSQKRVCRRDLVPKFQMCTHEGCSYESKFPGDFRRHLNSHLPFEERPDVTTCAQCGAHVLKEGLKQHVIRRHNPELADTILMCPYCSKTWLGRDRRSFEAHVLVHQGVKPFTCDHDQCGGLSFTSQSGLRSHVKMKHEPRLLKSCSSPIKCDHCDKRYGSIPALRKHQRAQHSELMRTPKWKGKRGSKVNALPPLGDAVDAEASSVDGSGPPIITQRWPCSFCELVCSTKGDLVGHLEGSHGVAPAPPPQQVDEEAANKKVYKCTWEGCTYASKFSKNLRRHLQSHLPREQRTDYATCDQCGVSVLAESLKQHVLRMHNPELAETILQCGYCDKKYFSWENSTYQAHLLGHQEGVKPFMCSECGAGFVSNGSLSVHVKVVHGPPPETPFKCDHCDKTYTKLRSLRKHVRDHHSDVALIRRRVNKVTMLNRMGTATKEEEGGEEDGEGERLRPVYGPIQRWPCSSCDVVCAQKQHLKRHVGRKHHGLQE